LYAIKFGCVAVFLSFSASFATAQFKSNGYSIGLTAGTLVYQGDLSTSRIGSVSFMKPAIGVTVSRQVDPYFTVRASLMRGKLQADESTVSEPAWRKERAFRFSTPVTELSVQLLWYPLTNAQTRMYPYVFAGAGASLLNISRDYSRVNTNYFDAKSAVVQGLAVDAQNNTPRVLPVIPLGAGLQYHLSDRISAFGEGNYRFTSSDYLDGFKYAANPNKKDSYYGVSVGIQMSLGSMQNDCPRVR